MQNLIDTYKKRKKTAGISSLKDKANTFKSGNLLDTYKKRQSPDYILNNGTLGERVTGYGRLFDNTTNKYNSFFSDENKEKFYNPDDFTETQNSSKQLADYANKYLAELESTKTDYDDNTYNSIKDYLTKASKVSSGINKSAKGMQDYYGQFKDEDTFNTFLKYENTAKANGFDSINDMANRISELKTQIENTLKNSEQDKNLPDSTKLSNLQNDKNFQATQAEYKKLTDVYNSIGNEAEFKPMPEGAETISEDDAMKSWAEYTKKQAYNRSSDKFMKDAKASTARQEALAVDRITANKQLEVAQNAASKGSKKAQENVKQLKDDIYQSLAYTVNKSLTDSEFTKKAMAGISKFTAYGQMTNSQKKIFDELTLDEKNLLGYLFETEGKGSTEQFFRLMQEAASYRKSKERSKDVDTWWEKTLLSVEAGADQFISGAEGFYYLVTGNPEIPAANPVQYASQTVREKMEEQGESTLLYDLGTTTTNMVPSIMAGVVTAGISGQPIAGTLVTSSLMGSSAAGNAYQQAIKEGYTTQQAQSYGLLIGVSETTLESILGGFGSVSGTAVKKAVSSINSKIGQKALGTISKVMAKTGVKLGVRALGEFSEEYLQDILEPIFRNICFDENNEFKPFTEEALYSGVLGALSSLLFSGGEVVINKTITNRTAIADKTKSIIDKAKSILPSEKAATKFENILTNVMLNNKISEADAKAILSDSKQSALFTEATSINISSDTTAQEIVSAVSSLKLKKLADDYTAWDAQQKKDAPSLIKTYMARKAAQANTAQPTAMQAEQTRTNPINHITEQNSGTQRKINAIKGVSAKYSKSGKSVILQGISNVKDGNVFVKTDNKGGIANIKDLTFDNPVLKDLYTKSAEYGTRGAKTFVAAFDGTQNMDEYVKMFNNFYALGKLGTDYKRAVEINSYYSKLFSNSSTLLAYFAGQNAVKAEQSRSVFKKQDIKQPTKAKGVYTDSTKNKSVSELAKKLYTAVAEKTGLDVESVDKLPNDANGAYANKLAKIILSENAQSKPEVLIHELSEFAAVYDKEGFNTLKDTVLEWYVNNNPQLTDAMVTAYQKSYQQVDKSTTYREASAEMVRDAFSAAFASEQGITDFVNWLYEDKTQKLTDIEKKSVIEKIKNFINKVITALKDFINHNKLNRPARKLLQADVDFLAKLRKDILNNWNKAVENYKAGQAIEEKEFAYSKKLGGYFPNVNVSTNDIDVFNISNINNITEVKAKVYNYLKDSYISTSELSKPITNLDTGMKIEVRKRGINETFGNTKAYKNLNRYNKKIKLATMTSLAKLIKYGEVRAKQASNYHNPNSKVRYAYLTAPINVDNNPYTVNMDIRLTPDGNRFYIHTIKIEVGAPKPDINNQAKLNTPTSDTTLSQDNTDVNTNIRKNSENDTLFIPDDEETAKLSRKIPEDVIKDSEAPTVFNLAKQSAQGINAEKVYKARRQINTFSLKENAAKVLGTSQKELNKMLRSWQYYSNAKEQQDTIKSMKVLQRNKYVAEGNRREMRETRRKIIKVTKDFSNKLLRETDTKHIPESLKLPIIQVLQSIDFTTDRTSPERGIGAAFTKLHEKYQMLEKSLKDFNGDSSISFDGNIDAMLDDLADISENKRLVDLSQSELNDVYDILKAFKKMVGNANKLFAENRKKTITEAGEEQMRVMKKMKPQRVASHSPNNVFDTLLKADMVKPIYFFEQVKGTPLQEAFQNLYDGENDCAEMLKDAETFAKNTMYKYSYFSWDMKKSYEFTNVQGKTINMTLGEMLSLYATYKREANTDVKHLEDGGFVVENTRKRNKKEKDHKKQQTIDTALNNIRFKAEDFAQLKSMLTDAQMNFVDDMVEYMSTDCAQWGNEVSLAMYDIRKFTEKYYFPFKVVSDVLETNPGEMHDIRVKNQSFTKRRVRHANAPLLIKDFIDVWAHHVDGMASYGAYTLPIEDFLRIWNYKSHNPERLGDSVKAVIKRVMGDVGHNYIKQLLTDVNGGTIAPTGEGAFNSFLSKFKSAAVLGNLRVVIQQYTAVARAMSIIEPKYFPARNARQINGWAEYQEAKKYAPVSQIKEWGYFDTHMAFGFAERLKSKDYEGLSKIKGVVTDKKCRRDALSFGAQKMDELAWGNIWSAAKNKIKAENPDIKVGSLRFYSEVSELFTDTIRKTQVYDSVLSRSQGMRSKGGAAKMVFAFMSEPITAYNMLTSAIHDISTGNKKQAMRKISSVMIASIFTTAAASIISAMRDDDEDKDFDEKYQEAFLSDLPGQFLGMVPYIREIADMFAGYRPQNTALTPIYKVYAAYRSLVSEKRTKSDAEALTDLAFAAAGLFGEPLANIKRDIMAIYNTAKDALSEDSEKKRSVYDEELPLETRYEAAKKNYDITKKNIDGSCNGAVSKVYYDLYFEATQEGNEDMAKEIKDYLLNNGRTEASIKSAYNDRLRKISPYDIDDLINALDNGEDTRELIKTLNENGYSNASIKAQLTKHYEPIYQKLYLEKKSDETLKIRRKLFYLGVGFRANTFPQWVRNILKQKNKNKGA